MFSIKATSLALLFSLIILPLRAEVLSYQYGAKKYSLTYKQKELHLKTVDIDIKFEKKVCFEEGFEKLKGQLENLLGQETILQNKLGDVSLNFEGKNYVFSSQSPIGQRVLGLPRAFMQYKLMEKDACKK